MIIHPDTATANHIGGEIHLEFRTGKGKQVIVVLPAGAGEQFLNDYEDALLEQEHALDRGAAHRRDPGRAA